MSREIKWKYRRLDQVARLVSGRTPDRENRACYAASGMPWVKIENLGRGVVREAAEYLSEEGQKKVNPVPEGSVLFSTVGTVGQVGIAGCALATNQQIVSLIFQEDQVLPLYGYYCLRYYAGEIRRLADQTTMAMISRKTLGQYRIPVPEDLAVQQEIAEALRKYDSYVEEKEGRSRQLSRWEGVLFGRIFGRELRFHQRLPLKEYLRETPCTGPAKAEDMENSGIPEKYRVHRGDILIHNGNVRLGGGESREEYFDRNVLCVRTDPGQLLPQVLAAWLKQPGIQKLLYTEKKPGDSRKRPIRAGELEKLEIPYFTMERQKDFAACWEKLAELQELEARMADLGRTLFEEMSRRLLTGTDAGARMFAAENRERPEADLTAVGERRQSGPQMSAAENQEQPEAYLPSSAAEIEEEPEARPGTASAVKTRPGELQVAHLVLAVLCGWTPADGQMEAYCRERQEIFDMLQPYFQPAAISLVTETDQKEYLLERDFLAYRAQELVRDWEDPMELLIHLLKRRKRGNLKDAHMVFRREQGLATEEVWEVQSQKAAARRAVRLLARYADMEDCCFLLGEGETE
ncbi:MAG TPA: restriction endonuclease subunit S [Candidatus Pullilachnospira intestinigallinarum]|nr:restriction endonuclease subunit S [Candidatus Pullilachnospira intestinigallinarum]